MKERESFGAIKKVIFKVAARGVLAVGLFFTTSCSGYPEYPTHDLDNPQYWANRISKNVVRMGGKSSYFWTTDGQTNVRAALYDLNRSCKISGISSEDDDILSATVYQDYCLPPQITGTPPPRFSYEIKGLNYKATQVAKNVLELKSSGWGFGWGEIVSNEDDATKAISDQCKIIDIAKISWTHHFVVTNEDNCLATKFTP